MTPSEVQLFFNEIQEYYGKQYPPKAIKMAWPELEKMPGEIRGEVLQAIAMKCTSYMPPLDRLLAIYREEAKPFLEERARRREREAAAEKREHEQGQSKALQAQGMKMAGECSMMVRALREGKITRRQYVEGHHHLHSLYPKAGFNKAATELTAFYAKHKLDLDKIALNMGC